MFHRNNIKIQKEQCVKLWMYDNIDITVHRWRCQDRCKLGFYLHMD
jgi:hypothetical protein